MIWKISPILSTYNTRKAGEIFKGLWENFKIQTWKVKCCGGEAGRAGKEKGESVAFQKEQNRN